MHTTPVSLLERLRRPDDREAWERFAELYTPLLYHWARGVGLQDQDAADLVQEVFTALVQKMPSFTYDPGQSFRAWLRAVIRNRWRDDQRRRGRRPVTQEVENLEALPGRGDADPFWEAEYRHHLVGRALDVMHAEFRPNTWRACWETVVNGRPAAEVAAELGVSENAVFIARCRVLRRLRQELEGLMD